MTKTRSTSWPIPTTQMRLVYEGWCSADPSREFDRSFEKLSDVLGASPHIMTPGVALIGVELGLNEPSWNWPENVVLTLICPNDSQITAEQPLIEALESGLTTATEDGHPLELHRVFAYLPEDGDGY